MAGHLMDKMTRALTHPLAGRYSRAGLWTLFLLCALPLHVWTLILALRDLSWVAARTDSWDALGVLSYGLVFAFIESLLLCLAVALLGLLVSTRWPESRRVALLGLLTLVAGAWAAGVQAYFVWNLQAPASFLEFAARSAHPLRILYALGLGLAIPSVLLPAWAVLRSDRFLAALQAAVERLAVLIGFYLFLDALGFLIIIIRNI
jgi:hypothetical protein